MSQNPRTSIWTNPYIQIARVDHWFKNVFILPGIVIAIFIQPELLNGSFFWKLVLGLLAAGLVSSSNYVLNETLDADKDRAHPEKQYRPVPSGKVNTRIAWMEWLILAIVGLSLAWILGKGFFYSALALWVMSCAYNIPPIRTKEIPYLDVLTESINNPLRLLLGWYLTGTVLLAPVSLLFAYWMIGAFFMAVKRLAEYRTIGDENRAADYRASFAHYNERRLFVSIVYYTAAFGLCFGIFLIRYRLELVLSIPLIAAVTAWYLNLGFRDNSLVQYPEKLYTEKGLMLLLMVCLGAMLVLLFVDIPVLHDWLKQTTSGVTAD